MTRYVVIDGKAYDVSVTEELEAARQKMLDLGITSVPTRSLHTQGVDSLPLDGPTDGGELRRSQK